jgi:glycosyltransferase involved in cell wall biosynthesis
MKVSVILPCRNEASFIAVCLDSIIATAWPHQDLELLVVDGRSTDGTQAIVADYATRHPWIRLVDNPRQTVPEALNLGIRAATGDVLVRVDAHGIYPSEYVPRLVAALEETGADNVGGTVVTMPASRSARAAAVAIGLSHPFGVGNSYFRIGTQRRRWVDTVPYGCWRREVFDRLGLFDVELVRDQDEEFNYRIRGAGGRVLLLPDVVSYYYARESPAKAARMLYQYGYFKPLVAQKVGRVATLRQLIPPLFVLAVVLGALLGPLWHPIALLWGALVVTYGTATVLSAAAASRRHGVRCFLSLITVFPLLHFAYGTGYLRGLWHVVVGRRLWGDPSVVPLTR